MVGLACGKLTVSKLACRRFLSMAAESAFNRTARAVPLTKAALLEMAAPLDVV
jgi:hypothetical protein